jgi:hypothetical protein
MSRSNVHSNENCKCELAKLFLATSAAARCENSIIKYYSRNLLCKRESTSSSSRKGYRKSFFFHSLSWHNGIRTKQSHSRKKRIIRSGEMKKLLSTHTHTHTCISTADMAAEVEVNWYLLYIIIIRMLLSCCEIPPKIKNDERELFSFCSCDFMHNSIVAPKTQQQQQQQKRKITKSDYFAQIMNNKKKTAAAAGAHCTRSHGKKRQRNFFLLRLSRSLPSFAFLCAARLKEHTKNECRSDTRDGELYVCV